MPINRAFQRLKKPRKTDFKGVKIMEKVINDYEIKEIALNPAYMTNDDLESLKNKGFSVRWMREDEGSDKNIFTITVDEN